MSAVPGTEIICLMEASLDGRVDESRWSKLYDKEGEGDPDVFYETYNTLNEDAALYGKETVRRHVVKKLFACDNPVPPVSLTPFRGIRETPAMAAVFDSHGTLAYQEPKVFGHSTVAVLGSDLVSEQYLRYLRSREISYTFAGKDGRDCAQAVRSLYQDFGLKKMYLAGGGLLNGSFLKQGLIDWLYLVLYPGIDGLSGVNSIFEYKGKAGELPCQGQSLELISCDVVRAGVVLLKYRFHRD